MNLIESLLLILAYSTILISVFVGIICFKKGIEKIETIAFSISLLFLIVSMSLTMFIETNHVILNSKFLTLISMVLVGLTTPMSVMIEGQHKIPPKIKKLHYLFFFILFSFILISFFVGKTTYLGYITALYLGASVIFSMIFIRTTKPLKNVRHLEKTNRIFAIAFLILVPLSLLANFVFLKSGFKMKIGFTLPLIFDNNIWLFIGYEL